jgi:hypothetical protein
MQCPFVYADGRQCDGQVRRVRAYGKHQFGRVERHNIRKFRLWCSHKDDHAGAVSSSFAKERMEFYPDDLQRMGLYDEALSLCENVE